MYDGLAIEEAKDTRDRGYNREGCLRGAARGDMERTCHAMFFLRPSVQLQKLNTAVGRTR